MRFILDRTNDSDVHSKKWIVGYGLLFLIIRKDRIDVVYR